MLPRDAHTRTRELRSFAQRSVAQVVCAARCAQARTRAQRVQRLLMLRARQRVPPRRCRAITSLPAAFDYFSPIFDSFAITTFHLRRHYIYHFDI
jgi:hypothetical protein